MSRNLFVGGVEQEQSNNSDDERTPTRYVTQPEEQFHIPAETRRRHSRQNTSRPERPMESARTIELEERTRVLKMAMGKILSCLIPDDPLIPLLNRGEQPATVVATRNSPALGNVVVPTKPRGSGRLNPEPSSSKHSDELMKKNAELEKQLKDIQRSIDELKSLRSRQQALDLDSAPLNLSITAEPYQEGFKIPHLETYDGSGNSDEHLHVYQAIMKIQNATDAMMCKIQHWVKRPPPLMHDSPRVDRSKYCDFHRGYGHNTEDCQNLKDKLEFLACNGKLEGYIQKPFAQQPNQTHFVQEYGRSQEQGYQLDEMPGIPTEFVVHKLSTNPTRKLVVQKRHLVGPEKSGKFLGYVVSKKRIEVNPDKVEAVQQMEPPKIIKDVQRLTGHLVALHIFIPRAANVEGSRAGVVLMGPDGFKSEHVLRFKFQTMNNAAEYEALVYGLKLASELKAKSIRVFSDSQLVVNQVNGSYDIKDPQLGRYAFVVSRLKLGFISFQIDKIPRVDNRRADELSKLASSQDINPQRTTFVEVLDAPSYTNLAGKGGCTYFIVAVDYFTKWIEAKSLSTTTERKIEEFLFNSILCRFCIPKRIIADNRPQFQAAALRSFCDDYNIELTLTSVYTPQSNKQAESANKIVLRSLKTRVLTAHFNWVDKLNKVPWSCHTTPSLATGETPFSLAYGAEAIILVQISFSSNGSARHNDSDNEQLLKENLDFVEEVREIFRIKTMIYQSRVARFYNKRVRARQFQVGDLVLHKAGLTNAYSHICKLAPNSEGSYMVICIKRRGSYLLADLQGRQLPFT
ncbi:hypothetical protein SLEP1_g15856 [Rubroshorea leprosula]|uniref:Uncharacterized protein n=1 Tax=Rubroshorea leprosula TaxID=152421 RepID=A0AAV5IUW1_9ROSI|nr:hypothetical protein SLEP1_g15856 [Rubroshorea leprosula]